MGFLHPFAYSQMTGGWAGQAKARGQKLRAGLPHGWQGPRPSGNLLLSRQISQELEQNWSSWDSNQQLYRMLVLRVEA